MMIEDNIRHIVIFFPHSTPSLNPYREWTENSAQDVHFCIKTHILASKTHTQSITVSLNRLPVTISPFTFAKFILFKASNNKCIEEHCCRYMYTRNDNEFYSTAKKKRNTNSIALQCNIRVKQTISCLFIPFLLHLVLLLFCPLFLLTKHNSVTQCFPLFYV